MSKRKKKQNKILEEVTDTYSKIMKKVAEKQNEVISPSRGHIDTYKGEVVIFAECEECGLNYEYCEELFPEDEQICINCLNNIPPDTRLDFVLKDDVFIETEELDEDLFSFIDEDIYDDEYEGDYE